VIVRYIVDGEKQSYNVGSVNANIYQEVESRECSNLASTNDKFTNEMAEYMSKASREVVRGEVKKAQSSSQQFAQ
jgi:hypothetical protein